METVVGIFQSSVAAEKAVADLLENVLPAHSITYLRGPKPEEISEEVSALPTTDAESDGMGKGLGALVGGAAGMGAGLALGSAITSFMVPGIGPIFAAGLGAAAVLGLGGAAAGAKLGDASEKKLDQGIARDDVAFYRDLLKAGRFLVVCACDSNTQAVGAVSVLENNGAEDMEAARQRWKSAA